MNGSQGAATLESTIPDTSNTVRNVNAGQGAAFRVFASIFLSAIYILNGRKVMSVILKADRKRRFNIFNLTKPQKEGVCAISLVHSTINC